MKMVKKLIIAMAMMGSIAQTMNVRAMEDDRKDDEDRKETLGEAIARMDEAIARKQAHAARHAARVELTPAEQAAANEVLFAAIREGSLEGVRAAIKGGAYIGAYSSDRSLDP